MPTEYWLQKKAFNSWSHVTWYATIEEAQSTLNRVAVEGNGYSWRMVKVDVVEERLLHDESPVLKADEDEEIVITPVPMPSAPPANGWGNNAKWISKEEAQAQWPSKSNHGMIGKVWLGNPVTKEKKRVNPEVADQLLKTGNWIKAGPRTVL